MTDLLTTITQARPTDADLAAAWPAADRAAALDRVLAEPAHRARWHRPALLAAAAVIAAGVALPVVGDSGDASAAADLHALALAATSYDGPVAAPGTWLHEQSTYLQTNHAPYQGGLVYDGEVETWTSWDGQVVYGVEHRPSEGWTSWNTFHEQERGSYADPTPQFAATLPDDADGLTAYLDPRVSGSSSHAEAMYSALVQLAGSHTLPPRTLAAAFEALATIEHVATTEVSVQGRPAVEVTYTEDLSHSHESIVLDLASGAPLSTHQVSRQSDYVDTTTLSEVVDSVPADVLEAVSTHQADVRYDDTTGQPLPPS